ncbi:hypothetical protein OEZ85_007489 [Tetradesmus obliquus]|uniref:Uncharacterized protein n=1 Tax=Tetradesmus obliquus TaxID=3088 RepID=A0ABY8TG20_TETOB|nr:hypothetical protein OEZ85_007489 [Tetradesmus obliquus]
MREALLLLVVAAGSVLAAAQSTPHTVQSGYTPDPVQGGYNCPGKIKRIWCYENLSGVLTRVITENESGGRSTFCNAGLNNVQPTRLLTLCDNENIIRITACRGAYYGYTKITFDTDKGQSITCGSASYTYKPDGYQAYGANYMSKSWRKPDSKSVHRPNRTRNSRNLLDDAAAASSPAPTISDAAIGSASAASLVPVPGNATGNATGNSTQVNAAHHNRERREERRRRREDTDRFFNEHKGWGWNSECQVYTSPKQPSWSGARRDWEKHRDSFKHDEHSRYRNSWQSYGSYYNDGSSSDRYYVDYRTYKRLAKKSLTQSLGYTPKYYYAELYPLADFRAACDNNNNVYDMYGFCWNKAYVPPKPVNDLIVQLKAVKYNTIAADVCPSAAQLQTAALAVVQAAANSLPPVAAAMYIASANAATCVPADATKGTNTTLLIPAKVTPINGTDLAGLVEAIGGAKPPVLNVDLCAYVICPADVLKLSMSFNSNITSLQSVLTSRVVRRRMAKMTVKVSRNAKRPTTKRGTKQKAHRRKSKTAGPK